MTKSKRNKHARVFHIKTKAYAHMYILPRFSALTDLWVSWTPGSRLDRKSSPALKSKRQPESAPCSWGDVGQSPALTSTGDWGLGSRETQSNSHLLA